jgi:hypothetical protein
MAGSCEHGHEPSGSIKAGNSSTEVTISFSRKTLRHAVS